MQIASLKQLSSIGKTSFCYVCGKGFDRDTETDRDHVPPKSIFAAIDRLDPLILPTHPCCNNKHASLDEKIGQLVAVLHKKYPSRHRLRLDVRPMVRKSGHVLGTLHGIDLKPIIGRWVRAFHAALYQQFLPSDTANFIHPPFPSAERKEGKLIWDRILPQQVLFVELIKKNRIAGKLDTISCCNRKCIYECTWEQDDNGRWMCIFALNLYDWSRLADQSFQKRGCVGFYMPATDRPPNASIGVARLLEIPLPSGDPLDPFCSSVLINAVVG